MQQIVAGMTELNERAQNAEARATEGERQAQATQQGLARSQAVVKGKGKDAATTGARDRHVCVEVPASAARRRGRQVERMGSSFFAVGLDVFFGVALAEVFERFSNHPGPGAHFVEV